MKLAGIWRRSAVALATLGLVLPHGALAGAGAETASHSAERPAAVDAPSQSETLIADLALEGGGMLRGQVVDDQGTARTHVTVSIHHEGRVVAKALTDADGNFAVSGLRGGVHVIATDQNQQVTRLWSRHTAPPTARKAILLASDRSVARAQFAGPAWGTWLAIGASTTAATVAGVSLGQHDDTQVQVSALQQQLNVLQQELDRLGASIALMVP